MVGNEAINMIPGDVFERNFASIEMYGYLMWSEIGISFADDIMESVDVNIMKELFIYELIIR